MAREQASDIKETIKALNRFNKVEIDGERVRAFRLDQRINQSELAEATQLSQSSISEIERGVKKRVKRVIAEGLAENLSLTVERLLRLP